MQPIEHVVIRNVDLKMENAKDSTLFYQPVNKKEDIYPDAQNYSKKGLPGYGFFVRNANYIEFENISITTKEPDARPCFVYGEGFSNSTLNGESAKLHFVSQH